MSDRAPGVATVKNPATGMRAEPRERREGLSSSAISFDSQIACVEN